MKFLLLVVVLCLAVTEISGQSLPHWKCRELQPWDRSRQSPPVFSTTRPPYHINVQKTKVRVGEKISVTLSVERHHSMHGFILQMRHPGSNTDAVGEWSVRPGTTATTMSCFGETEDTVTNKDQLAVPGHDTWWTAPAHVPDGGLKLILVGAALDGIATPEPEGSSGQGTGTYWHLHRDSFYEIEVTSETVEEEQPPPNRGGEPTDNEETSPDPDPSLVALEEHDLLEETRMEQEYKKRKEADIAQENLATETDALAALEQKKKQHEAEYKWEQEDYEKRKYEEEVRRQARIDAELLDKEEWDEKQREAEEEARRREQERRDGLGDTLVEIDINEKPGKTADATRHTATIVLCTVCALLFAFLL